MLYITSPASGAPGRPVGERRAAGPARLPALTRTPPPSRGEVGAPREVPAAPPRTRGRAAGHPQQAHLAAPPFRKRRPRAIQSGAEKLTAPIPAGTPSPPRASPGEGPAWHPVAQPGGAAPRVLTAADTALSSALSSSPKPSQSRMLPRTAPRRRSLGGGTPAAQCGAPRGRPHMRASPLRGGRGACNASGARD